MIEYTLQQNKTLNMKHFIALSIWMIFYAFFVQSHKEATANSETIKPVVYHDQFFVTNSAIIKPDLLTVIIQNDEMKLSTFMTPQTSVDSIHENYDTHKQQTSSSILGAKNGHTILCTTVERD